MFAMLIKMKISYLKIWKCFERVVELVGRGLVVCKLNLNSLVLPENENCSVVNKVYRSVSRSAIVLQLGYT